MFYEDGFFAVIVRAVAGALIGAVVTITLFLSFLYSDTFFSWGSIIPATDVAMTLLLFLMPLSGMFIGASLMIAKVTDMRWGVFTGVIEGTVIGFPLFVSGTPIFWPIFGTGGGILIGAFVTVIIKFSKRQLAK